MTFGERVRQARESRGWRRIDLANKIGASYETIKRIENNPYPPKGSEFRTRIEFLFNLSGDDPDGVSSSRPLSRPTDTWAAATDAQLLAQLTALVAELSARQASGALGAFVAQGDEPIPGSTPKVDTSGEHLVTVSRYDMAKPESFTREPGAASANQATESEPSR